MAEFAHDAATWISQCLKTVWLFSADVEQFWLKPQFDHSLFGWFELNAIGCQKCSGVPSCITLASSRCKRVNQKENTGQLVQGNGPKVWMWALESVETKKNPRFCGGWWERFEPY